MSDTTQTDIKQGQTIRLTLAKAKEYGKAFGFTVRHDVEWHEYVVRYKDGITYRADDLQDAVDTAIWEVQRSQGKVTV
jgi:hypothetical protein